MLSVFSAMDVSASGLSAQRTRMNTIASNLANSRTTRTEEGGAYKRVDPVFEAVALRKIQAMTPAEHSVSLVGVSEVVQDQRPGPMVYEPNHPDADAQGYVEYPNVNVVEEMVNMISATRSYEANVTAVKATKEMVSEALEIGR